MSICGFNKKMLEGLTAFNKGLIGVSGGKHMSLCGFNEKMLEGIKDFNEELVNHGLIYRSRKNGETLTQAVNREIADMTRILQETYRIEDTGKRLLTEGIVQYAMGFYLSLRKNGLEETVANPNDLITNIGEYFFNMDDKYYGELEGLPNDTVELAEYLNRLKV